MVVVRAVVARDGYYNTYSSLQNGSHANVRVRFLYIDPTDHVAYLHYNSSVHTPILCGETNDVQWFLGKKKKILKSYRSEGSIRHGVFVTVFIIIIIDNRAILAGGKRVVQTPECYQAVLF